MKNIKKLTEKKLEQILLDSGYIDMETLKSRINESQLSGKGLEPLLIEKEDITENTLAHAICSELNLPFLSLKDYPISSELIQEIPKSLMVKHQFIPLDKFDNVLNILVTSTFSMEMVTDIQSETQKELFVFIGLVSELRKTIDEYITEEEQEAINTEVIPEEAQVTAGWESIFDDADQAVMNELKQKAIESGIHTSTGELSQTGTGESSASQSQSQSQSESQSQQYTGEYTREHTENLNDPENQYSELEKLAAHLKQDPFDYDAMNKYVAIALSLGDMKLAIAQLMVFAKGLEGAGDVEGAINCYQYIIELDPGNQEALACLSNK